MKRILLFLVVYSLSFSLELDSIDFDKKIKIGSSGQKEYILINNSDVEKEFHFSSNDDNVKIYPKGLRLIPYQSKKFVIKVSPKEIGKREYYLIIKEITRVKKKDIVNMDKIVRIKQGYQGI